MSCFIDTPVFCGSEALVRLAGLQLTGKAAQVRTPTDQHAVQGFVLERTDCNILQ